jgi:hypothetical protein
MTPPSMAWIGMQRRKAILSMLNLVRRFAPAHPIARVPWSAIRRIGQSRLLTLTIVIPFLGSLLLFNQ